jgi:hypothetical protein
MQTPIQGQLDVTLAVQLLMLLLLRSSVSESLYTAVEACLNQAGWQAAKAAVAGLPPALPSFVCQL